MPHSLVALMVPDSDPAIDFFVNVLDFDLVELDVEGNRWDLVGPPSGNALD